jgi:hypothetical protein
MGLQRYGPRRGPLHKRVALPTRSRLPSTKFVRATAFLSAGRTAPSATVLSRYDEAVRLDTIERGMRLHAHARAVLSNCAGPLTIEWHLSAVQIQKVLEAFGLVVGGPKLATSPAPAPVPTSPPRLLVEDYGPYIIFSLRWPRAWPWHTRWQNSRRSAADLSRTAINASSRRTWYWARATFCTRRSAESSAAVKRRRWS